MAGRSTPYTVRRRDGSPYYQIRFTRPDGSRAEISTKQTTRREALKVAPEIYAQQTGTEATPASHPLRPCVESWLAEVLELKSTDWHERCEDYAVHWLERWDRLEELSSQAIQEYVSDCLADDLSPSTVRKHTSALRQCIKWCVRQGYLGRVPSWEDPKAKSEYRATCLTAEEVERVLKQLPARGRKGEPIQAYYTLLWETGLRRGAWSRIKWEDIDLDHARLHLRPSVDKTRQGRWVPLSSRAVSTLSELRRDKGLVFGWNDYRVQLRAAAKAAKIPPEKQRGLTANHSFRHARVTHLLERTQNIAGVMHMTGITTMITLKRYMHESEAAALEVLSEISGSKLGQKDPAKKRGQRKAQ